MSQTPRSAKSTRFPVLFAHACIHIQFLYYIIFRFQLFLESCKAEKPFCSIETVVSIIYASVDKNRQVAVTGNGNGIGSHARSGPGTSEPDQTLLHVPACYSYTGWLLLPLHPGSCVCISLWSSSSRHVPSACPFLSLSLRTTDPSQTFSPPPTKIVLGFSQYSTRSTVRTN